MLMCVRMSVVCVCSSRRIFLYYVSSCVCSACWRVSVLVFDCHCGSRRGGERREGGREEGGSVSLCRANVHVCGVWCVLRVANVSVCLVYSSYIQRFSSFKTPWFFSGTSWAQREVGPTTFECSNVVGPPVWPNTPISHKRKKNQKRLKEKIK